MDSLVNNFTVIKKGFPYEGKTVLIADEGINSENAVRILAYYRTSIKYSDLYRGDADIYLCHIQGEDTISVFKSSMFDLQFLVKKEFKYLNAFKILVYKNEEEVKLKVWNSRDGDVWDSIFVEEFVYSLTDFNTSHYPFYVPKVGEYIWKDYSEEEIDSYCSLEANKLISLSKEDPSFKHLKEYSFDYFYNQFLKDFKKPVPKLHTITEEDFRNNTYTYKQ